MVFLTVVFSMVVGMVVTAPDNCILVLLGSLVGMGADVAAEKVGKVVS